MKNKYLMPSVVKGWGGTEILGQKIGEVFVYHDSKMVTDKQGSGAVPNPIANIMNGLEVETVKILYVEKDKKSSIHFHLCKYEYFYIVNGEFLITVIENAKSSSIELKQHDCFIIPPGLVHQIIGVGDNNILLEISTLDKLEDSYKIQKGD